MHADVLGNVNTCDVRTLLVMNIVAVVLGIIIYGMGSAVFVFGDPFPEVRALIPARDLTSREPSWSVSNSVESGLGPENLSLEMEFVYTFSFAAVFLQCRPSHRRENGP